MSDYSNTNFQAEDTAVDERNYRSGASIEIGKKTTQQAVRGRNTTWWFVNLIIKVFRNLAAFLDGFYTLAKKIIRFWWIGLILCVLFYPAPVLEFLAALVRTIEQIKILVTGG